MGSFQNATIESIAKASVITELQTQTQREVLPSFSTISASPETWAVAFAPDFSYFAWSCGNRVVKLVPWDKEKRTLANTVQSDNNGHHGNPDQPPHNHSHSQPEILRKTVTINCKDLVWSLAFGWSVPEKKSQRSSHSYRLFGYLEQDDDLVLAIGLKSGHIKTYNVRKGENLLLMDHRGLVRDIQFSPDGSLNLVSASQDGTLKIWDLKDDGNMVATLKGHPHGVQGCAISPDASILASVGEQRSVIIWNLKTHKMLRKLQGHHNNVTSCEFSVDGACLATASYDTRVILWDPYTGEMLSQYSHIFPALSPIYAGGSNSHYIRDIAFSSDGLHFATVCDDNYVRVWLLEDNSDPVLVSPLSDAISCSFSPDGSVLAAGTRKGSVQFIAIPRSVKSLRHLCRLAFRRSFPDSSKLSQITLPKVLRAFISYRNLPTEIGSED
ncbi:WD repeat and SOCS box-containing protein 1-like [Diadema antillarum]|uniref:WD repeat and SOCS box-containing protein 1-like n=1 Tax=Diadema antillarum TaxID=105358 RepID=UPI003A83DF30